MGPRLAFSLVGDVGLSNHIVCHVGIHINISSLITCWTPHQAFTFQWKVKMNGPGLVDQHEVGDYWRWGRAGPGRAFNLVGVGPMKS